jgi:hypothetical protein
MLLVDLRENSMQTKKCATFELAEEFSITGAALWKNDDGVVLASLLAIFDSFRNLLLGEFLAFFRISIQKQAMRKLHDVGNKWKFFYFRFSYETS